MYFYHKRVVYLSLHQENRQSSGWGFVRLTEKDGEYCFKLQAKIPEDCQGKYPVYLLIGKEKVLVSELMVQAGAMQGEFRLKVLEDVIYIGGNSYALSRLWGIEILLSENTWIRGIYQEEPYSKAEKGVSAAELPEGQEAEGQRQEKVRQEPEGQRQELRRQEPEGRRQKPIGQNREEQREEPEGQTREPIRQEPAGQRQEPVGQNPEPEKAGDPEQELLQKSREAKPLSQGGKWKKLKEEYPQVHPFGDDRCFISLEPGDLVILPASFQKLLNNSFLLHGFYNYRPLILGPDRELSEEGEENFYIGVPGTYFEREKMVAVMFGFEGFEGKGPVEIGSFGYYMRKVNL